MGEPKTSITGLLHEYREDPEKLKVLMESVYRDLHQMAERALSKEKSGHTLQPTALINEAFLRFVEVKSIDFKNRAHFFAFASTLMRRVLINHAVGKQRKKRGGKAAQVVTFDEKLHGIDANSDELIELDEALKRLASEDERIAKVVECRYFAGMEIEEIAEALEVSPATVKRDWQYARAWLYRELTKK